MLSEPFTTSTVDPRFKVEQGCECGCTFNSTPGFIVSNSSCTIFSMWTILAEQDYRIRLAFIIIESETRDDQVETRFT